MSLHRLITSLSAPNMPYDILLTFSELNCLYSSVLARPKQQGAAPCCFSVHPVVFLQRTVVFCDPEHFLNEDFR